MTGKEKSSWGMPRSYISRIRKAECLKAGARAEKQDRRERAEKDKQGVKDQKKKENFKLVQV